MQRVSLLLALLLLAGCDKLTGAADQKIADAEAIGFACRVSGKAPEACMKENEAQSPSSILDGWKAADDDIRSGKLNPNMEQAAGAAPAAEAASPEGDAKPAEGDARPAEKKDGKVPEPVAEGKTKH